MSRRRRSQKPRQGSGTLSFLLLSFSMRPKPEVRTPQLWSHVAWRRVLHTRLAARASTGGEDKKEVFTDVSLRHAPISVHVTNGSSARHRIRFNKSPGRADKEWEEKQLREHLGPTVRMCLFEHVEGSTVCQGLFKHFTLPNGKTVHYYHQDKLHEIVASTIVKPPRPPLALSDIFQDAVPRRSRIHEGTVHFVV